MPGDGQVGKEGRKEVIIKSHRKFGLESFQLDCMKAGSGIQPSNYLYCRLQLADAHRRRFHFRFVLGFQIFLGFPWKLQAQIS